jgi:hypothetical protein
VCQTFLIVMEKLRELFRRHILNRQHKLLIFILLWFLLRVAGLLPFSLLPSID